MHEIMSEILVTREEIQEACERLGKQITSDYKDKNPILLGLLKGCVPFMGDLAKEIDCKIQIGYMDVSSYNGTAEQSNEIKINKDINLSVEGRHILIAEDIVDTGNTLQKVIGLLEYRGAKSVEVVTLLNKEEGRQVRMKPKYIGVEIPNKFVVGYGLDWEDYYRNIPYVGVVRPELYK